MYKNKYFKYKNKYLELKRQLGGAKKFCQPNELMESNDYKDECTNANLVIGSCSHPPFDKYGSSDISESIRDEYLQIFNLINQKKGIKYLDIILGAVSKLQSSFEDLSNSFQLFITPIDMFNNYETLLENINNGIKKEYFFNSYFPLNYKGENSRQVLDLLIEINNNIKIRITNKMCGTCHRSLYYLVNNKIDYIVDPEQGTSSSQDKYGVKTCFKDIKYIKHGQRYVLIDYNTDDVTQVWPAN